MKKLLVLALVLGIASLAPASIEITVDGLAPVDSEISLMPSDNLTLQISGATVEAGETIYWMMVVNPEFGTLNGGEAVAGGLSSIFPYYYTDMFLGYAGLTGSAVSGSSADSGIIAQGVLVDNITFHCEALGDAVVQLLYSGDTISWEVVDTAIIHQVPEPATMALLGLGALVLRRKK